MLTESEKDAYLDALESGRVQPSLIALDGELRRAGPALHELRPRQLRERRRIVLPAPLERSEVTGQRSPVTGSASFRARIVPARSKLLLSPAGRDLRSDGPQRGSERRHGPRPTSTRVPCFRSPGDVAPNPELRPPAKAGTVARPEGGQARRARPRSPVPVRLDISGDSVSRTSASALVPAVGELAIGEHGQVDDPEFVAAEREAADVGREDGRVWQRRGGRETTEDPAGLGVRVGRDPEAASARRGGQRPGGNPVIDSAERETRTIRPRRRPGACSPRRSPTTRTAATSRQRERETQSTACARSSPSVFRSGRPSEWRRGSGAARIRASAAACPQHAAEMEAGPAHADDHERARRARGRSWAAPARRAAGRGDGSPRRVAIASPRTCSGGTSEKTASRQAESSRTVPRQATTMTQNARRPGTNTTLEASRPTVDSASKRVVTASTTPAPNNSRRGCGKSSSLTITRIAAASRPISMPLPASEKEQPQAAKVITVSVENSLSSRSKGAGSCEQRRRRADGKDGQGLRDRIAAPYDGRASAGRALSRNHETDEKPSTVSNAAVSATRPWRAKVLAKARVMAPSSQPLSPISKQADDRAPRIARRRQRRGHGATRELAQLNRDCRRLREPTAARSRRRRTRCPKTSPRPADRSRRAGSAAAGALSVDARLTSLVALALFVLSAWPLLLVDLPPFQDLPNHVATAHIIAHLDLYPQFAFNGLFKSNALLTLWLHLLGNHGLFGATRAFVAIVLAGERARAAAVPDPLLGTARSAGRDAVRLAPGPQLPGRDGLLELRVRVRAVADSADRARSTARAPHRGARPGRRRALGRDLVRAPLPARDRRRAGRAARRHPRHLAGPRHGGRRAAVAARARGPAVARGRAPAPGQGRARHHEGGRHVFLPEPVGDPRPPVDRRLRRADVVGKHDPRSRPAARLVRLEAAGGRLVRSCRRWRWRCSRPPTSACP